MHKIILAFVSLFLLLRVTAQPKELPAELDRFVLKGYEWLDFAKEDMNADGKPDYILVLKQAGEDTITLDNAEWDPPRPLLLIVTRPSGELKQWVRNDEIVMCRRCGGAMGDPYEGITTQPGEFTLSFYGGSSWRWGESYTFRHDKIKKNWFLEEHFSMSYQAADPEAETEEYRAKREETGDITLEKFTPDYNVNRQEWKVTVPKTFFYSAPDKKSEPRKAFLLKGDVVKGFRVFKNFIECTFTNKKGVTTSGFIRKTQLAPLKVKP